MPKNNVINILAVDDDPADLAILKASLNNKSQQKIYNVDAVSNYEDAREIVNQNKHDIYFIDYYLGSRLGSDLIKDCFKDGHEGPFIFLTGENDEELYTNLSKMGVYDFILKSEIQGSVLDRAIIYAINRKKKEEALKAEKSFSSNILREMPYMVLSITEDGTIRTANKAAMDITGYNLDDLVNHSWLHLFFDPEELVRKKELHDNKESDAEFQASILCEDGRVKIVLCHFLSSENNANSKERHFTLIGKDLTDALQKQRSEHTEEKLKSLGALAGGLAHEMSNLVQPLLFSTEMIKRKGIDKQNEDLNKYLDIIESNTNQAKALLDDVLSFARVRADNTEETNILSVTEEALEFSYGLIPNAECVEFTHNIDKDFYATLSKSNLLRVLSNLLINASSASNEGQKIKVSLSITKLTQEVAAEKMLKEGFFAKLKVTDSGCGIETKNLQRIFEPFFTTKHEENEGTGLGLALVNSIVNNWNGTVTVDSIIGQGSTFNVYIPVTDTLSNKEETDLAHE
jgi:PAS domain S-box-containing protein